MKWIWQNRVNLKKQVEFIQCEEERERIFKSEQNLKALRDNVKRSNISGPRRGEN